MTEGLALSQLSALPGISGVVGDASVIATGVQSDSRRVLPGDIFAAIVGANQDGTRFTQQALDRGAVAVLSQVDVDADAPVVRCDNVRRALGPVAHEVYGRPSLGFPVVGITGTNGKTTVAHLVESVLEAALGPVAISGTIAMRGPTGQRGAALTTPEADGLARFLRRERAAGAHSLVMEVSSIALVQHRVAGMRFRVAAFTNLSQDHLDFHTDMQTYGEAKRRLFEEFEPEHSVICVDHAFGRELAGRAQGRLWRCAVDPSQEADVRIAKLEMTRDGLSLDVETPLGELHIDSPLIGRHNAENLVVTVAICAALGIPLPVIANALCTSAGAPGRMERIEDARDVAIFVDYAHTPDAVARSLEAVRAITRGRLWIVVGCGGDRDRGKRAPMAAAAVGGADIAILTSDNPRTEDPQAILGELLAGAQQAGSPVLERDALSSAKRGHVACLDRADAIRAAITHASPGDTVLVAGKGHESYQIVGTEKRPFDDRDEARAAVLGVVAQVATVPSTDGERS